MSKLNCRLIVSDFDGTLANSQNEVDEEVLETINNYIADGGIFAVCTGRILASILPRIKQLGLGGLVVASQGSTIADIKTGKIIRNACMSGEHASEICAALEGLNTNVNVYEVQGFISDMAENDVYLNQYEEIIGVKARHVNQPLSQYVKSAALNCNKVATLCAPADQPAIYESMLKRFGKRFDVTCSASVLVEISPYGETKGAALKFLADYYGVPMDKTCAIGDNLNDLSMIEVAGYGVAVGNSSPLLLERAKYVTVTNDMGAVAEVIREYGYIHD